MTHSLIPEAKDSKPLNAQQTKQAEASNYPGFLGICYYSLQVLWQNHNVMTSLSLYNFYFCELQLQLRADGLLALTFTAFLILLLLLFLLLVAIVAFWLTLPPTHVLTVVQTTAIRFASVSLQHCQLNQSMKINEVQ